MRAPAPGQVWIGLLRGRVSWARDREQVEGRVELTWVSSDGRVVEGYAPRPGKERKREQLTLPRSLLIGRVA